jgi:hypothetical protein
MWARADKGAAVHQIFLSWLASAVVLVGIAWALGRYYTKPGNDLGILVDSRGRMSLTHLQLVVWSLLILSLISGLFFGRWWAGVSDPLAFDIPDQVLGLMGIVTGSAVAATITKTAKDNDPRAAERIPASEGAHPRLSQIFTLEEGAMADEVIDVTKFQNFAITLVLVAAYFALAVHAIRSTSPDQLNALPSLPSQFLTLLGISHAGYVAGKLPNQSGLPGGKQTVADRDQLRREQAEAASATRAARAHVEAAPVEPAPVEPVNGGPPPVEPKPPARTARRTRAPKSQD